MERSIGTKSPVYVWMEMTQEFEEMITDIELSHSDPRYALRIKVARTCP
jgi:hypothetical protein